MEYFIGAMIALISIVTTNILVNRKIEKTPNIEIKYSQSHIYSLISPFYSDMAMIRPRPSQSSNYHNSLFVKVMVLGGSAYWIKENKLYIADMSRNGVDQGTTREVDTFSMSKKELEQVMFIVEKLREEMPDENWGPGKP
jgi:hypothetical protein